MVVHTHGHGQGFACFNLTFAHVRTRSCAPTCTAAMSAKLELEAEEEKDTNMPAGGAAKKSGTPAKRKSISLADELVKLKELEAAGVLTQEEFSNAKEKAIEAYKGV